MDIGRHDLHVYILTPRHDDLEYLAGSMGKNGALGFLAKFTAHENGRG